MRSGAASNINVVPVPRILTFNAVMLLAAGFCIPAILGLIFTWDKILEINWKRRRSPERSDDQIEGADMTISELRGINSVVRKFLSVVEIPLFGGVIITMVGVGEANFYSSQMRYDTEPMASIGQWSPIAGTILAALGSLYLLWSSTGDDGYVQKRHPIHSNDAISSRESHNGERHSLPCRPSMNQLGAQQSTAESTLGIRTPSPNEMALVPTITYPEPEYAEDHGHGDRFNDSFYNQPTAGRHRVRRMLTRAADYMGNAAHEKFDTSDFHDTKARQFPAIPGEERRNPDFDRVHLQYDQLRQENSRAASEYAASVTSISGMEGSSTPPAHNSPQPEDCHTPHTKRRDTLEVPASAYVHQNRRGTH
ncbi:hypothetical protein ACN47E_006969 [Coniothyrium glycines]